MNRPTLRRFSAASVVALVGGLVLGPLAAIPAAAVGTTVIDVMTFNDFHGRLETSSPSGGAAVLATVAKQMRAANPNTIVASAGDNVGATTFTSFIANDQPTIDALNAMGVDVSALGNHEFDQGRTDVDTRLKPKFNFPLISANIIDKTTNSYAYDPYFIKTLSGVRVAFVGAITEDMPGLVSPAGIATLQFNDITTSVNKVAGELRDGNEANGEADVVILLVHEGAADGSDASVLGDTKFGSIVQGTAGHVDAIVSGHSHQSYSKTITVGTQVVPVIQSAKYGEQYGHLTISVDSTTHKLSSISATVTPLMTVATTNPPVPSVPIVPADPAVKAIVDSAVANSAALGAKSLGSVTADLKRAVQSDGKSENRGGESTMSNLLADVNLWATSSLGSQLAIQNPGGVRADILYASSGANDPDGNVTYKEAATVQPFANTLVTMDLTGAQLKQILEEQWQPSTASKPYLKLGVSKGFQYTYDPAAATGSHITAMYLGGAKVTDTQVLKVATNNFLSAGGDQFFTFAKGSNVKDSGQIDLQSFVAYMAAKSPVSPDLAQRAVGVSVAAPVNGSTFATGETVTVMVSSMLFSNAGATTGDATLSLGGKVVATAPLSVVITSNVDEQGQATLSFVVPKGLYGPQVATLAGPGGTSIAVALPLQAPPVATTVTGSASPWLSLFGKNIVYTATVKSADGTAAAGPITVYDKGKPIATGIVVNGVATVALPRLSWGVHFLTAAYAGDNNHKPSRTTGSTLVLVLL